MTANGCNRLCSMIKGDREYQTISLTQSWWWEICPSQGQRISAKDKGLNYFYLLTGRNDLWGYHVYIVGKDFHAGHSQCLQINNQVATTDHHFLFTSRDIRPVQTSDVIVVFAIAIVSVVLLGAGENRYDIWLLKSRFHYRSQFCLEIQHDTQT